ncbi:MAG: aminotransferase class I/II-fold pyridoxal phosphate-dependent enzyme [Candidatus Aenigmarchaeota archaeon]|nr:aminotransferase class I/II-fold pyridoxal phosphate-dependent enzyme [Candidatus Aenigmarchaeota archaeon]
MIKPAKRTENITYAIRDVVVEADKLKAKGKKILHLNIGNPNIFDFKTPRHMIDAVKKAMDENRNGYAHSMGLDEGKEAIVRDASRKGIQTVKDDVIICSGVSEGIEMCFAALLNPGENILTPSPGYPLYTSMVHKFQGVLNQYKCIESDGWQPDIEDIRSRINEKTRGIVIINPNNPTGALYGRKVLKEIIDLANEHDLVIFSDEIYDKILFDGESHISTASISKDIPILTFNGLSKNYLAPGWRIAWMMFSGPEREMGDYKEGISKFARARLSSNFPIQYAIKPALEGPQDHIPEAVKKLEERRNLTFKRMNEIKGFRLTKPKGAFYAFPGFDLPVKDDKKFVMDLLREKLILFVHGTGFGYEKPDHMRIVFLPDMETLSKAYDKLEEYVNKHF